MSIRCPACHSTDSTEVGPLKQVYPGELSCCSMTIQHYMCNTCGARFKEVFSDALSGGSCTLPVPKDPNDPALSQRDLDPPPLNNSPA